VILDEQRRGEGRGEGGAPVLLPRPKQSEILGSEKRSYIVQTPYRRGGKKRSVGSYGGFFCFFFVFLFGGKESHASPVATAIFNWEEREREPARTIEGPSGALAQRGEKKKGRPCGQTPRPHRSFPDSGGGGEGGKNAKRH